MSISIIYWACLNRGQVPKKEAAADFDRRPYAAYGPLPSCCMLIDYSSSDRILRASR